MKKYYLLILIVMTSLLTVGITACSESDNEVEEFPNWQKTNADYFDKKYAEVKALADGGSTDWKVLCSWSLNPATATHSYDHVLVNVLNAGTGSGCPLYTDSVKVHYSGRLLPSTTYKEGYVFDQSWQGDYNLDVMQPRTFAVNAVENGFATALQQMHIGDRWRVYIPYQLGYGSATNAGAAYSTLVFDMTLVGYFRKAAPAAAPAQNTADAVGNTTAATGYWVYE